MANLGFSSPYYTRTSLKGITSLRLSLAQRDTGFPLGTALPILYPDLSQEDIRVLICDDPVRPTDEEVGRQMAGQASTVKDVLEGNVKI